jgi:hypothetical protein
MYQYQVPNWVGRASLNKKKRKRKGEEGKMKGRKRERKGRNSTVCTSPAYFLSLVSKRSLTI